MGCTASIPAQAQVDQHKLVGGPSQDPAVLAGHHAAEHDSTGSSAYNHPHLNSLIEWGSGTSDKSRIENKSRLGTTAFKDKGSAPSARTGTLQHDPEDSDDPMCSSLLNAVDPGITGEVPSNQGVAHPLSDPEIPLCQNHPGHTSSGDTEIFQSTEDTASPARPTTAECDAFERGLDEEYDAHWGPTHSILVPSNNSYSPKDRSPSRLRFASTTEVSILEDGRITETHQEKLQSLEVTPRREEDPAGCLVRDEGPHEASPKSPKPISEHSHPAEYVDVPSLETVTEEGKSAEVDAGSGDPLSPIPRPVDQEKLAIGMKLFMSLFQPLEAPGPEHGHHELGLRMKSMPVLAVQPPRGQDREESLAAAERALSTPKEELDKELAELNQRQHTRSMSRSFAFRSHQKRTPEGLEALRAEFGSENDASRDSE